MIDRDSTLSILRQCELLGLCRSSLYSRPQPISEADVLLMRRIDELHLTHPFLGARRLGRMLQREGVEVGRRRGTPCVAVHHLTTALFLSKPVRPLLTRVLSSTFLVLPDSSFAIAG